MTDTPQAAPASGDYYFCLTHQVVERGQGCRALDRMGPYPSAEAAAAWQQSVAEHNEAWDKEDREEDED
jgi:hypothetical protein